MPAWPLVPAGPVSLAEARLAPTQSACTGVGGAEAASGRPGLPLPYLSCRGGSAKPRLLAPGTPGLGRSRGCPGPSLLLPGASVGPLSVVGWGGLEVRPRPLPEAACGTGQGDWDHAQLPSKVSGAGAAQNLDLAYPKGLHFSCTPGMGPRTFWNDLWLVPRLLPGDWAAPLDPGGASACSLLSPLRVVSGRRLAGQWRPQDSGVGGRGRVCPSSPACSRPWPFLGTAVVAFW